MEINGTASIVIIVGLLVNLSAVGVLAWTISRFMARVEIKVQLMWADYQQRHNLRESEDV